MSTKKPEEQEKLKEVELAKPHTHKGQPLKEGAKIKVNERQDKFLRERKKLK